MAVLEVNGVKKIYTPILGGKPVQALNQLSFSIQQGEFTAIMGESGSGKTTLLNIIATLDRPTVGSVVIDGRQVENLSDQEISVFRREHLGFVFQDFNLLDNFSVKDNILLPLVLAEQKYKEMEPKLTAVVKRLNISDLLEKFPYELSGGQKQRTAIARAIITNPQMLLADEPTGSLDSNSADHILNIFREINQNGQTILMVTHSIKAASKADRILFLRDGSVFHQIYRGDMTDAKLHKKISDTLVLLASGGVRDE